MKSALLLTLKQQYKTRMINKTSYTQSNKLNGHRKLIDVTVRRSRRPCSENHYIQKFSSYNLVYELRDLAKVDNMNGSHAIKCMGRLSRLLIGTKIWADTRSDSDSLECIS